MRFSTILALIALAASAAFAETTVRVGKMHILESKVHPGNILPSFLFAQGSVEGGGTQVKLGGGRGTPKPFTPDDTVGPEIWEGAMDDVRSPQLPYLTQDQWGCEHKPDTLDAIILESSSLQANITPAIGGKVWSTLDKVNNKQMFMNNRAHQAANIGALKAWAAGGVETNFSPGIIGHSAFTESPTFAAKIDTPKGPIVRIYEYDRYNSSLWQSDYFLDDEIMFLHARVINPTDVDLRGYWWTCVAHSITPNSRVISPANRVVETAVGPLRDAPWPYLAETLNASYTGLAPPLGNNIWQQDHSFIGNVIWGDFFLRIPKEEKKYIMHVEEDGYSVYHGHTLDGTKFFTWGNHGPGRFMQDFLSGFPENRAGDYAELQVGPAPTQMQSWPLPKNTIIEWTEHFKAWSPTAEEKTRLQHSDYDEALDATKKWREGEKGISQERVDAIDAFMKEYASYEVKEADILFKGMPWGALQEKVRAKQGLPRMAKSVLFSLDEKDWEVRPWVELVDQGTFSAETLRRTPISFQVAEQWRLMLEQSVKNHGATWLHLLHLGIISAETGLVDESRQLFVQSMSLKPSAVAARNIALLCPDATCALPWFQKAWGIALTSTEDPNQDRLLFNLGAEIAQFLQSEGTTDAKYNEILADFLAGVDGQKVPETLLNTDQVLTSRVAVAIFKKNPDEALDILAKNCFPTYGRARKDLIAFWHAANLQKAETAAGRKLNRGEAREVRWANKPPRNIGCPYADTYCTTYW